MKKYYQLSFNYSEMNCLEGKMTYPDKTETYCLQKKKKIFFFFPKQSWGAEYDDIS